MVNTAETVNEEGVAKRVSIHPDVRLAMLAARNSSVLGPRAYKKVFDLSPQDLRLLGAFIETLADYKELDAKWTNRKASRKGERK
jgi:hypothetical protein